MMIRKRQRADFHDAIFLVYWRHDLLGCGWSMIPKPSRGGNGKLSGAHASSVILLY